MRRTRIATFAVFVAVAALPARDKTEDKKKYNVEPKGWTKRFNGTDLKGWKVYSKGTGEWKVKDGVIFGSGKASHLFSERGDYKNFHFKVEAKINDKGNSGQYFRTKFESCFPTGWAAASHVAHGDR